MLGELKFQKRGTIVHAGGELKGACVTRMMVTTAADIEKRVSAISAALRFFLAPCFTRTSLESAEIGREHRERINRGAAESAEGPGRVICGIKYELFNDAEWALPAFPKIRCQGDTKRRAGERAKPKSHAEKGVTGFFSAGVDW